MRTIVTLFSAHALLGCLVATGLGEEITSAAEKRALATEMFVRYQANSGAIRTWTGRVNVETVQVDRGKKTTSNATVTFWSDELSRSNKTTREVYECFEEYASGNRRNLLRTNDAVLLKDGETYSFPTRFHPDTPKKQYERQLVVGQEIRKMPKTFFFPTLGAMNESAYAGYFVKTYFPCFMKASDESLAKIPVSREGNIVTIVDTLVKNDVLVLSNTRVFDLDRGASLIRFEYEAPCIQKTESWKCEYQQADGIWIPKRTESTIEYEKPGLVMHEKTEWAYQILNGAVAMELSPTTLGARQGDKAYNHKTDTHYVIKDDDYPAQKESP